jgi:SAM-dependent methyltransferase
MTGGVASVRAEWAGEAAGYPDRKVPEYRAAVASLGLAPGAVVLDAGCGAGRALEALAEAVGPAGTVIGLDATPEMLAEAAARGREALALLVAGDLARPPLAPGSVDVVFAAGLLPHLPDPAAALAGLAGVTRPGGRLLVFHAAGRAGGFPPPDSPAAPAGLRELAAATGWSLTRVDHQPETYGALLTRERHRVSATA